MQTHHQPNKETLPVSQMIPGVDLKRLEKLLEHESYKAIVEFISLPEKIAEFSGKDFAEVQAAEITSNIHGPIVSALQARLKSDGYTGSEISAALLIGDGRCHLE